MVVKIHFSLVGTLLVDDLIYIWLLLLLHFVLGFNWIFICHHRPCKSQIFVIRWCLIDHVIELNAYIVVLGYAVAEGRPVRERRLPCCGIGCGWFL